MRRLMYSAECVPTQKYNKSNSTKILKSFGALTPGPLMNTRLVPPCSRRTAVRGQIAPQAPLSLPSTEGREAAQGYLSDLLFPGVANPNLSHRDRLM